MNLPVSPDRLVDKRPDKFLPNSRRAKPAPFYPLKN
jgi:hypothetical protein